MSLLHISPNSTAAVILACLPLLLAGCTTPLPRVQHSPAQALPFKVELAGALLAARPVVDKEELNRHFGNDLLALRILPVQIVFTNNTHAESYLVEGTSFSLDSGAARATSHLLPSAGAGLWLGGGGLIGGTIAAIRENARVSVELADFRSYTVSPGRTAQGFLFFKLPERATEQLIDLQLRLNAVEVMSGRSLAINLPFSVSARKE